MKGDLFITNQRKEFIAKVILRVCSQLWGFSKVVIIATLNYSKLKG
jgi:hypothetical protein